MSELLNPYTLSPVIGQNFVGREKVLRQLRGRIVTSAQPQHCVVIGETGIGRTSLLQTFIREYAPKRRDLLVHFLSVSAGVARRGNTDDFYRWLFVMLAENLTKYEFAREEASAMADPSLPLIVLEARIQRLFRHIYDAGAGYYQLIALDGFDLTTRRYDFDSTGWGLLRQLGENPDYGLCYLFGSRVPIDQLEQATGIESNLAGIFGGGTIHLRLMPSDEASALVDWPVNRLDLAWPSPLRELILSLGGGHPQLLQMICAYLFDQLVEGKLDMFMEEESRLISDLQEQFERFFSTQEECLRRRELFDTLLKLAHGVPVDASSGEIDRLERLGYLLRDKQQDDRFQPFSPLLDYYLRACGRRVSLWPDIERTEAMLRALVESRYRGAFGDDWLDEVRLINVETERMGTLDLVEYWEELRQNEQNNLFLRQDAPRELIQYAGVTDLKLLIWLHFERFADIFPPAKQAEFERDLNMLGAARAPTVRYRRISREEVRPVEECCRRLLQTLSTTTRVPGTPVLPSASLLNVDDRVNDRYIIKECLVPTERSQVVKAWDTELNMPVAIKFLRLDDRLSVEQKAVLRDLLRREARIIAQLMKTIHPNVGIVLNTLPEHLAVVKPWLECKGRSFEEMVEDETFQIPLFELVSLGVKLADALEHVHNKGIVHRDIKPSNILLNEGGEPVLIDFDVAHAPEVGTLLTGSRSDRLGTPLYSAPEQLDNPNLAGAPADIFALGVVLYQALTHTYPYPYGNRPALYGGAFPEPSRHDIPPELYRIIRAMLSQQVEVRPTAGQLREQLQVYLQISKRQENEV
jgi:hypothetical protein